MITKGKSGIKNGNEVSLKFSLIYSAIVESEREMVYVPCFSAKNYFLSFRTRVYVKAHFYLKSPALTALK